MPRVTPFYAVKCNPDHLVVRTLAILGAGFDCASTAEMQMCTPLVQGPVESKIIFANPCKMERHIRDAQTLGVPMMTFDNAAELRKIHRIYPDAKCVVRIAPPSSKAKISFTSKFGASEGDSYALLELAHSIGANIVGVSFHVGSGCDDDSAYVNTIAMARRIFDKGVEYGFNMNLLDIGGGFLGQDLYEGQFARVGKTVSQAVDDMFPESSGVSIIAEPGRFFATAPFTLAVTVIAKREVSATSCNKDTLYYVSDGVYGSFNNVYFDHAEGFKPRTLRPVDPSDELTSSTMFGPTCDSADTICKGVMLPDLNLGDWVYFENMGAYTIAAASSFNGFNPPTCRYVFA